MIYNSISQICEDVERLKNSGGATYPANLPWINNTDALLKLVKATNFHGCDNWRIVESGGSYILDRYFYIANCANNSAAPNEVGIDQDYWNDVEFDVIKLSFGSDYATYMSFQDNNVPNLENETVFYVKMNGRIQCTLEHGNYLSSDFETIRIHFYTGLDWEYWMHHCSANPDEKIDNMDLRWLTTTEEFWKNAYLLVDYNIPMKGEDLR